MHLASEDGHLEILKLLLEAGANRYLKNTDEQTPADVGLPPIRGQIQRLLDSA